MRKLTGLSFPQISINRHLPIIAHRTFQCDIYRSDTLIAFTVCVQLRFCQYVHFNVNQKAFCIFQFTFSQDNERPFYIQSRSNSNFKCLNIPSSYDKFWCCQYTNITAVIHLDQIKKKLPYVLRLIGLLCFFSEALSLHPV